MILLIRSHEKRKKRSFGDWREIEGSSGKYSVETVEREVTLKSGNKKCRYENKNTVA
jgi:hypothetical protein